MSDPDHHPHYAPHPLQEEHDRAIVEAWRSQLPGDAIEASFTYGHCLGRLVNTGRVTLADGTTDQVKFHPAALLSKARHR
ncbi:MULTISPECIES: hypothetical protein [unclassified Luteococcus]|uniref:hypothetical protein n=1 Tax=unclassified Luteococcus TaxID=2639923 RepID=UPI00313E4DB4